MCSVNDNEYAALLEDLRERTRGSGRRDLDDLLAQSRLVDVSTARQAVLAYLSGLRDDMVLRSQATAREVEGRLRRFRTEAGGRVEGVVVDVQDWDQRALGFESLTLTEITERDESIQRIDALIALVAEDEDSL